MQVSIINAIKISKSKNPGESLSIIQKWLEKKYSFTSISFELSDSEHNTVSAVSRVAKNIPQFSELIINHESPTFKSIIGLNKTGYLKLLNDICLGVPRKYPFFRIHISLNNINWYTTKNNLLTSDFSIEDIDKQTGSKIIFVSDWWISGRENYLIIVSPTDDSILEQKVLPYDSINVSWLLQELSEKNVQSYRITKNENEEKFYKEISSKMEEVLASMQNDINTVIEKSIYFDIIKNINWSKTYTETISIKKEINSQIIPLGYKYISKESGRGVYIIRKKTKNNNIIQIFIDLTPMGHLLSSSIEFLSINGKCKYEICLPFRDKMIQCPITNQNEAMAAVSIYTEVIKYLENQYIANFDKIAGLSPVWF
jgi:hypothetical protein